MKKIILLTFQPIPSILSAAEQEFTIIREAHSSSTERVPELAKQHQPEALLIANGQRFDATVIERLPTSVKIIATCSVGFEHIDIGACAKRNIFVTNTPDVLTEACADLTMFILLGAARRGKEAFLLAQSGWGRSLRQGDLLGLDLRGKKLGILGMGRIGRAVAARARAFGMEIIYCNRRRLGVELELGARHYDNLHEMLPHCDFFSLHMPGTLESKGFMGAREFALLPPRAVFVNISRGSLVDEEALILALQSRKLFAAGLDVCLNEPNPNPRLLKLDNVFFTPHIASATEETRHAMGARALANIRVAMEGGRPKDLL